jgi:hypothetical protein
VRTDDVDDVEVLDLLIERGQHPILLGQAQVHAHVAVDLEGRVDHWDTAQKDIVFISFSVAKRHMHSEIWPRHYPSTTSHHE